MGGRTDDSFPDHSSSVPFSYAPLPAGDEQLAGLPTTTATCSSFSAPSPTWRWALRAVALSLASVLLLALVTALLAGGRGGAGPDLPSPTQSSQNSSQQPLSRGPSEGVSEKSSGVFLGAANSYHWTSAMLRWQRTAFHFQPEKNWMNDPDGPLYYKGWYHLFYQYNPDSAVWGNITWGHAISRDLVQWFHLPIAMVPDRWYDANGVWTGSATILPDGRVVMLYTGSTNASIQVQNLALPADPEDPLLLRWSKHDAGNPVLVPPPGTSTLDFRDPTTAWYVPTDATWRLAIGSKDASKTGISLVYRTKDFFTYDLFDGVLHAVPGTGMWECVDFYPVATEGRNGVDTSESGPGVKHVLKASLDDDKHDYYAIGTYDSATDTWTPDDPEADVGIGLRLDYGKYYAAKTFYDEEKRRRVLWSWIGETDSEGTDLAKGWSSVLTIPRTVLLDQKTGSNLLQWPVEEVDRLRATGKHFDGIVVRAGSVVPLDVGKGTQLDIVAEFEIGKEALEGTVEADVGYNCSTSGGAAGRGALGPFGLLVLADHSLSEQTAVYFYVARKTDGQLGTFICQDELRSSRASGLVKRVHGSTVPVLDGEKLSVRTLVDHSVVETFAQGGRTCITSRVYPTEAIYGGARVFLFNNATGGHVTATSVKIWPMNSAFIRPYAPEE